MKTLLTRWLPLLLIMVMIYLFSMSTDPYKNLPDMFKHIKNTLGLLGHFFEYSLLGIAAANAIIWKSSPNFKKFTIVFLAGLLYALSDEIHQLFVPGRAFELVDLLLDAIGILIGLLIYMLLQKKFKNKLNNPANT